MIAVSELVLHFWVEREPQEWILKTTQVLCKDLRKITHTGGKMKLRSHTDWVEWSLKYYFKWLVSHQASVKLGTNCSCAGAGTKFDETYRETSTAVLRLFYLIRVPVVGAGFLLSGGGNHHFKVWIRSLFHHRNGGLSQAPNPPLKQGATQICVNIV